MNNRSYFFVDDIDAAKQLVPHLKEAGLDETQIHVIAKEDTSLEPLPEPDIAETSDVFGAAKRGAIAGGTMGLLGGLAAMTFPAAGLTVGGGALIASTALGGALGTWFSTLIGVSVPNEDIAQYQDRIEKGEVMILVDADDSTAEKLADVVESKHPGTVISHGELQPA